MRLGIFAKTFLRPSSAETFDAVRAYGLDCVQFNMSCTGLEPMPARIETALCRRVRAEAADRGISIAAVSGTFNMIHPDPACRQDGLRRLAVLAHACRELGTDVITLCTGTRDSENMWRRHPDNDSVDSWSDLLNSMHSAIRLTESSGVTLAFEPESSNVVNSANKARKLLDAVASPRLQVVLDGANLFHDGDLSQMDQVLDDAVELLRGDIVLAHAKDFSADQTAGNAAIGSGGLDFERYVRLLHGAGFDGPVIIHGALETQVHESVSFLRDKIQLVQGEQPAISGDLN